MSTGTPYSQTAIKPMNASNPSENAQHAAQTLSARTLYNKLSDLIATLEEYERGCREDAIRAMGKADAYRTALADLRLARGQPPG